MKELENMRELNEAEEEKVAGGVPILHPGHHYDPPAAPQEPAEPQPEPGPMGQQVSPGEEFNAILDLFNSRS